MGGQLAILTSIRLPTYLNADEFAQLCFHCCWLDHLAPRTSAPS
jgi:hypothetical protein